jgi:hypothetical protein
MSNKESSPKQYVRLKQLSDNPICNNGKCEARPSLYLDRTTAQNNLLKTRKDRTSPGRRVH